MFQTKVVKRNQDTHFVFSTFFFRKSCRLLENVQKYCRARQANDDNMAHAHCMLDTYGYIHTHTHTHTHTHSGCVILIPLPLQQWLHERASMLCYTHIAYLVGYLYINRYLYLVSACYLPTLLFAKIIWHLW